MTDRTVTGAVEALEKQGISLQMVNEENPALPVKWQDLSREIVKTYDLERGKSISSKISFASGFLICGVAGITGMVEERGLGGLVVGLIYGGILGALTGAALYIPSRIAYRIHHHTTRRAFYSIRFDSDYALLHQLAGKNIANVRNEKKIISILKRLSIHYPETAKTIVSTWPVNLIEKYLDAYTFVAKVAAKDPRMSNAVLTKLEKKFYFNEVKSNPRIAKLIDSIKDMGLDELAEYSAHPLASVRAAVAKTADTLINKFLDDPDVHVRVGLAQNEKISIEQADRLLSKNFSFEIADALEKNAGFQQKVSSFIASLQIPEKDAMPEDSEDAIESLYETILTKKYYKILMACASHPLANGLMLSRLILSNSPDVVKAALLSRNADAKVIAAKINTMMAQPETVYGNPSPTTMYVFPRDQWNFYKDVLSSLAAEKRQEAIKLLDADRARAFEYPAYESYKSAMSMTSHYGYQYSQTQYQYGRRIDWAGNPVVINAGQPISYDLDMAFSKLYEVVFQNNDYDVLEKVAKDPRATEGMVLFALINLPKTSDGSTYFPRSQYVGDPMLKVNEILEIHPDKKDRLMGLLKIWDNVLAEKIANSLQ